MKMVDFDMILNMNIVGKKQLNKTHLSTIIELLKENEINEFKGNTQIFIMIIYK